MQSMTNEMAGQSGGRLKLSKLNDQLTCKLCGGYFIDATTIIECLHSFCRSCIVKYLNFNKYCPICEVQVHKSRPLVNIRPDHTLQDIVYKLVPGCYQNEMRCRREFWDKNPEAKCASMPPEARGEPIESHIYSPDESLSLSLEYYKPTLNESPIPCSGSDEEKSEMSSSNKQETLPRRYLRCPAAVTVFHLQKLIRAKYGLSDVHRVDIMYKEEALYGNYTLMDVMYIYHWRRKVPLHLSYRIFESSPKRIKLSDDNEQFKKSLTNAGISSLNFDGEQPQTQQQQQQQQQTDGVKKEWKEVQLKISETGVMSVTGITSPDSKKIQKQESLEEEQKRLDESVEAANATTKIEKTEQVGKRKTTEEKSSTSAAADLKKLSSDETKTLEQKSSAKVTVDNVKVEKNVKVVRISQESLEKEGGKKLSSSKGESGSKSNDHPKKGTSAKNNSNMSQAGGSKIDALSAKLQFQPKVGQVNNTYSKKGQKERKTILEKVLKNPDNKKELKEKMSRTSGGGIIANLSKQSPGQLASNSFCNLSYSPSPPSVSISITSSRRNTSPERAKDSTSAAGLGSSRVENSESINSRPRQQNNISPSNESLANIGLNVSTALISFGQSSAPNYPYSVQDIVNNAIRKSPSKNVTSSQTPFNLQTPSMSIYSIPSYTGVKNTISSNNNSTNHSQTVVNNSITTATTTTTPTSSSSSTSTNSNSNASNNKNNSSSEGSSTPSTGTIINKLNTLKSNLEITSGFSSSVPPCPDAIPISLMKPTVRKTEIIAKGTNLNEICAKIGTSGSKINDICAKIGETSKERDKNKLEIKTRPEIPDLLKITKKPIITSSESSSVSLHIPNIPNVPCYTPGSSNSSLFGSGTSDSKGNKSIYTSSSQGSSSSGSMSSMTSQSNILLKGGATAVKKQPPSTTYRTLREPPKPWNPTLTKNNYVAMKNQEKESAAGNSKSIMANKPSKNLKVRNVPRYLGNPLSGVKPMYGVTNDGGNKETASKDQSPTTTAAATSSTSSTATTTVSATNQVQKTTSVSSSSSSSLTKIDQKTLSPTVPTSNSPIVSPPPYSPSARSYQNTSLHSRDICRSTTNSPLSPRNSPVNMLSTNPFIPSPTPNTNPRLFFPHYSSPLFDSQKFTNSLIRSSIGIAASPSAFHSSLPPTINKLYPRTSYTPQTSSSYGQNTITQSSPSVQRIPANSLTPKSPKNSTTTGTTNKNETQTSSNTVETTSDVSPVKSNSQECNAFNLTKVQTKVDATGGVAVPSDLSKTSSSSSSAGGDATNSSNDNNCNNNQTKSSDDQPKNNNQSSNLAASSSTISEVKSAAASPSKKEENVTGNSKKEETTTSSEAKVNEKSEKKEELKKDDTASSSVNQKVSKEKESVSGKENSSSPVGGGQQTAAGAVDGKPPSKINGGLSTDGSGQAQSTKTTEKSSSPKATTNESEDSASSLKDKKSESLEKQGESKESNLTASDLKTCDELEQIQGKKSHSEIQRNKAES